MTVWVWLAVGSAVVAILAATAAIVVLVAPIEVRLDAQNHGDWFGRATLRWLFGGLRMSGRWEAGEPHVELVVAGLSIPERRLWAMARRLRRWVASGDAAREPFDWRAWLRRAREGRQLPALREARTRLGDRGQRSQLWREVARTGRALLAELRLSARIHLRIGSEDPFALGVVAAADAVVRGMLPPGSVRLEPGWDEQPLSGAGALGGRVRIGAVLWLLFRFVALTPAGRRCLRAGWAWWWYPRTAAKA